MKPYLPFLLMAMLTVLSPGPGVVMTLTNTLRGGLRSACVGIVGIAAGAVFVAAISATSLGGLLAASEGAFAVLKFVGAAYLVYLGVRLWRARPIHFVEASASLVSSPRQRFLEGFSLQLTNPKVIFFFLSVFPQVISPGKPQFVQFTMLALTYGLLVIGIHFIYALFASKVKRWLTSGRGGSVINKASGTTFICFGVMLAAASR